MELSLRYCLRSASSLSPKLLHAPNEWGFLWIGHCLVRVSFRVTFLGGLGNLSLVDCNGLVDFTLDAFGFVSVCGRRKWHGDSETKIVSCFGLVLDEVDKHAEWGERESVAVALSESRRTSTSPVDYTGAFLRLELLS